tara:strand:- start:107 stop:403 length:297 start_codon:yes stop_codon:yes gene_type:complete
VKEADMAVKFQSFDTKTGKWVAHQSKVKTAAKAAAAGKAVRVVHPNGSWKVVKNPEALPDTMATSFVAGRDKAPKKLANALEALGAELANKAVEAKAG